MANQKSDPLYVKLSQAGIAAHSTLDHLSENYWELGPYTVIGDQILRNV